MKSTARWFMAWFAVGAVVTVVGLSNCSRRASAGPTSDFVDRARAVLFGASR